MSFKWYDSNIPKEYKDTFPQKFIDMRLKEVEKHAKLLYRLRYDKVYAKKRIKDDIIWEYELTSIPSIINKVDEIIDKIYSK